MSTYFDRKNGTTQTILANRWQQGLGMRQKAVNLSTFFCSRITMCPNVCKISPLWQNFQLFNTIWQKFIAENDHLVTLKNYSKQNYSFFDF